MFDAEVLSNNSPNNMVRETQGLLKLESKHQVIKVY